MATEQEKSCLVVMGASSWPNSAGQWPSSGTFLESASAFIEYAKSDSGLQLGESDILNLFDHKGSVDEIDFLISEFLKSKFSLQATPARNLFLYYVGHGAFSEGDEKYCLTLHRSRIDNIQVSAYRLSSLARTISQNASTSRRYLIIDACFAGAANADFLPQSDPASRIKRETFEEFPASGTALLCAASSASVALAPRNSKHTMFSGALLSALCSGDENRGTKLSLSDINQLTRRNISKLFHDRSIRPELHIPDQRGGDIASLGVFPNPAKSRPLGPDGIKSVALGYENNSIVSDEVVSEALIDAIADDLFNQEEFSPIVRQLNSALRDLDSEFVRIRMGALVINSSATNFWRSLFLESSLSGHRTVAALLEIARQKSTSSEATEEINSALERLKREVS